ncbi:hypothetical protein ACSBR2_003428 [Camellia fascicularis]
METLFVRVAMFDDIKGMTDYGGVSFCWCPLDQPTKQLIGGSSFALWLSSLGLGFKSAIEPYLARLL